MRESPVEIDNRHSHIECGNGGWARRSIEITEGDRTSDVRPTGESIDSASLLEWAEIENYGTDSEAADYLINRDGTCDYGEIREQAKIEAYEVTGKGT